MTKCFCPKVGLLHGCVIYAIHLVGLEVVN